ncbi:hypothetical protein KSP39_PZI010824 [Platanthera zijinensis]|uniref:Integrase catalytic domain-containing protein n=1 Tax=Platanthera zijinensis TaxID=2320716 RepID=A0AAP0BH33_9ASPA
MAAKFEISKYDGKIDFGLWQKRIKAVLVQQGLHKALLGKEKSGVKKDEEWEELDLKAISTIQLSLADESYDHLVTTILYGKDTLKMEEVMTTLLSNETRSKPGPSTSEGTLEAAGCSYTGEGGYLKVKKGALVVMKGERSGTLYKLIGTTIAGDAAVSETTDEDSSLLWHARLGHMSERGLLELHKKGLLKGVKTCKLDFCETCVLGKQHRVKFVTSTQRSKQALEYIHSDVWGSAPEPSLGGARYFVTFIDDFSRKVWIYFLKHKFEVFEKFKVWKTTMEKQTGKRVKYLRSDNGGEYTSAEFQEYCNQEGITRHLTIPGTPQQNGVAERMNRTLLERARCMRLFADLPRSFWAEAINTACYLVNRSPSMSLNLKSPQEVWLGRPVDYSDIHIFGCPVYTLVQDSEKTKLDAKSKRCIYLGRKTGTKGFKLWNPDTKKVEVRRDVIFDEASMLKKSEAQSKEVEETPVTPLEVELEGSDQADDHGDSSDPENADAVQPTEAEPYSIARERARREVRLPLRLHDTVAYAFQVISTDPGSYKEAVESRESSQWKAAMEEEMESLRKNQTWDLVRLPKGAKAISSKWIFRKKESTSGKDQWRYKARFVAKGFAQKKGVDFDEIFSPVVKHCSIRVLLAMVAMNDMELEQMDVKTAFLHGNLEEEIYILQPEGFVQPGDEKKVCKLRRSLYGLKQAPRMWNKRFDTFMVSQGFSRSQYDSCAYYKFLANDDVLILMLYVDDMLIVCKSAQEIQSLKQKLQAEFEMKDLGQAQKILGMEIKRDRKRGMLSLSQTGRRLAAQVAATVQAEATTVRRWRKAVLAEVIQEEATERLIQAFGGGGFNPIIAAAAATPRFTGG